MPMLSLELATIHRGITCSTLTESFDFKPRICFESYLEAETGFLMILLIY